MKPHVSMQPRFQVLSPTRRETELGSPEVKFTINKESKFREIDRCHLIEGDRLKEVRLYRTIFNIYFYNDVIN